MTDSAFTTAEELLEGILAGRVPRQVRLFAAQGLLPVSRDDLIRLQLLLSADCDPELARHAENSVLELPAQVITTWLESSARIRPIELDLLIRIREDESIWVAVAQHPQVSDETLSVLASHGPEVVQDVIVTNQMRLLECLEVLESLKENPRVTQVVLRRVREFEEEFIRKAASLAAEEEAAEAARGPSIEEALASLRAIGATIPKEVYLPYPDHSDPQLEEEVAKRNLSVHGRMLTMSVRDKVISAIRGTREERGILINSRSRLVMRAVLSSPKLTDSEIEKFAASRAVSDEVLRAIADNTRWMRQYRILLALVQNPKAPIRQSIQLLTRLTAKDLTRISRDRNANPTVSRQARALLQRKRR